MKLSDAFLGDDDGEIALIWRKCLLRRFRGDFTCVFKGVLDGDGGNAVVFI